MRKKWEVLMLLSHALRLWVNFLVHYLLHHLAPREPSFSKVREIGDNFFPYVLFCTILYLSFIFLSQDTRRLFISVTQLYSSL